MNLTQNHPLKILHFYQRAMSYRPIDEVKDLVSHQAKKQPVTTLFE